MEVSFTVEQWIGKLQSCIFDSHSLFLPGSDEFKCQVMNPVGDKGHYLVGHFPRYRWDPFAEKSRHKTSDSGAEAAAIYF